MSDTLLSVENLSVALSRSPETRLVRSASLSVRRGRVTGLVGESGCGKSLTCLSVLGLLPEGVAVAGGSIDLLGTRVDRASEEELRDIRGRTAAFVLQNPASCFDPLFTIRRHFAETLSSHGVGDRKRQRDLAAARLVEVGFPSPAGILDAYPFQLSGGMLQRVMIAIALLFDPPLLVADEPTTDLDSVSQSHVLDLLQTVRKRHGMSILLVTHDLSVIDRMADDVFVMRCGEIVDSGTKEELFERSRQPYTRLLVEAHRKLCASCDGTKEGETHAGAAVAAKGS